VRRLEGRPTRERPELRARYLKARGVPVVSQPYQTFEGSGDNFVVEVGDGGPTLILIGHHDAVPGSPGANDNASAVAILIKLVEELLANPPRRLRVRLLFTGGEELGYLGARAYVRSAELTDVIGVLSLELCGIGDSLAVWDAVPPLDRAPMLQTFSGVLEDLGYRRDETYHVVGRIPVFGSDHRAFSVLGIPAFGLTVVPSQEADALRRFVLSPVWSVLHQFVRRPPPFHTYHTAGDRSETLEVAALERTSTALCALVRALDGG
jgi:Zn-dependent M28 family amino/carboxypeptidase